MKNVISKTGLHVKMVTAVWQKISLSVSSIAILKVVQSALALILSVTLLFIPSFISLHVSLSISTLGAEFCWMKSWVKNKNEQKVINKYIKQVQNTDECMRLSLFLTEYNKANDVLWLLFYRNNSYFSFCLRAELHVFIIVTCLLTVYLSWVLHKHAFYT